MLTAREATPVEPTQTRWDDRFWGAIAVVSVLAIGMRAIALFVLSRPNDRQVWGDGSYYLLAARAVADGDGFVNPLAPGTPPDAHHPPLWTMVLALGNLAGLSTPIQLGLLAAFLGVVTVILIGVAGRKVLSARVGVMAATIAALYPGLWIYERNLNAEALALPLVALTLILAYRYRSSTDLVTALCLAVAIALLTLTRPEQLLCLPFILIPLVMTTSDLPWARRLGRLALAAFLIVALLSPWTIYNAGRFDRPVLLSTGSGTAMTAGACDATFEGERLGSYDFWACRPATIPLGIDSSVEDLELREAALSYTRAHLHRFPLVLLVREARTWGLYRPGQQAELHSIHANAGTGVVWAQMIAYWFLLPFAICGAFVLRWRRVMLYPLLVFPVVSAISTAITFGDIRYRAPVEVSIIILAAVAIAAGWRRRADAGPDQPPVIDLRADAGPDQPPVIDLRADAGPDQAPVVDRVLPSQDANSSA